MKIYNATPHVISIISNSDCEFIAASRKFVSENPDPIIVIPSSGMKSVIFESIKIDGNVIIPMYKKTIKFIEPLPDGYDIYIVSALYASAYEAKGGIKDVYTVADPVYTLDCKTIIGCLGLMKPDIQ
jgi:hypothetical protein